MHLRTNPTTPNRSPAPRSVRAITLARTSGFLVLALLLLVAGAASPADADFKTNKWEKRKALAAEGWHAEYGGKINETDMIGIAVSTYFGGPGGFQASVMALVKRMYASTKAAAERAAERAVEVVLEDLRAWVISQLERLAGAKTDGHETKLFGGIEVRVGVHEYNGKNRQWFPNFSRRGGYYKTLSKTLEYQLYIALRRPRDPKTGEFVGPEPLIYPTWSRLHLPEYQQAIAVGERQLVGLNTVTGAWRIWEVDLTQASGTRNPHGRVAQGKDARLRGADVIVGTRKHVLAIRRETGGFQLWTVVARRGMPMLRRTASGVFTRFKDGRYSQLVHLGTDLLVAWNPRTGANRLLRLDAKNKGVLVGTRAGLKSGNWTALRSPKLTQAFGMGGKHLFGWNPGTGAWRRWALDMDQTPVWRNPSKGGKERRIGGTWTRLRHPLVRVIASPDGGWIAGWDPVRGQFRFWLFKDNELDAPMINPPAPK